MHVSRASAVAQGDVKESVVAKSQPAPVVICLRLIHGKKNVLTGGIDCVRAGRGSAKFRNGSLQGAVQASGCVVDVEAAVGAVIRMKSKSEQAFFAPGNN